jgi:hypothetical protein
VSMLALLSLFTLEASICPPSCSRLCVCDPNVDL